MTPMRNSRGSIRKDLVGRRKKLYFDEERPAQQQSFDQLRQEWWASFQHYTCLTLSFIAIKPPENGHCGGKVFYFLPDDAYSSIVRSIQLHISWGAQSKHWQTRLLFNMHPCCLRGHYLKYHALIGSAIHLAGTSENGCCFSSTRRAIKK